MKEVFQIIGLVILFFAFVIGLAIPPCWYSSCRQAKIYNTLHKTEYTCGDFFWASNQINSQSQTVNLK